MSRSSKGAPEVVIKGSKDAVAAGLAKVKAFLGKIESKFIEVPGLLCWQNRRLEATVLAEASQLREFSFSAWKRIIPHSSSLTYPHPESLRTRSRRRV